MTKYAAEEHKIRAVSGDIAGTFVAEAANSTVAEQIVTALNAYKPFGTPPFDGSIDKQVVELGASGEVHEIMESMLLEHVSRTYLAMMQHIIDAKHGTPADWIEATLRFNIGITNALILSTIPLNKLDAASDVAQQYVDGLSAALSKMLAANYRSEGEGKSSIIGVKPKTQH